MLWKGANWTLLKTQSGELLGCKLAEYNAGVCAFVNYLVGVSDSGEGHSKMLAWSNKGGRGRVSTIPCKVAWLISGLGKDTEPRVLITEVYFA